MEHWQQKWIQGSNTFYTHIAVVILQLAAPTSWKVDSITLMCLFFKGHFLLEAKKTGKPPQAHIKCHASPSFPGQVSYILEMLHQLLMSQIVLCKAIVAGFQALCLASSIQDCAPWSTVCFIVLNFLGRERIIYRSMKLFLQLDWKRRSTSTIVTSCSKSGS